MSIYPRERCPSCEQRTKIAGIPCLTCGWSSSDDMEICAKCGEVKSAVVRCTSAKCAAERFLTATPSEDRK